MNKVNEMYFSKEEVDRGLHLKLISFLLDKSVGEQGELAYYEDIHVKNEDDAVIVEWQSNCYDSEYSDGKWEWVDVDHVVMKELILPDNTIQYVFDDDEEEAFNEWLTANPTYHKNQFGVWTEEGLEEWINTQNQQ